MGAADPQGLADRHGRHDQVAAHVYGLTRTPI